MRYLIYMLFVSGIALIPDQVQAQVHLDSCQARALQNYPLINQYDLIDKSRAFTLSNAGKSYLPQLDVTMIGGIIDGMPTVTAPGQPEPSGNDFQFITMLQLNQVIWDGGITKARKQLIEASSQIEKAELEVSLYALEERVNNLFFGILLIDEQIAQLELLHSTLERNRERVEVAVANGTAFKSDVDEVSVEIINTEQRISELHYNRKAYLQLLSAMTGAEYSETDEFIRPVVLGKYQNLEVNRPELDLLNNRIALVEAQQNITKAALYPKLGLMGFATLIQPGVDFGTSTINNVLLAGVSLNWRIGELYQYGNTKKLTEVNNLKINLQKETFLFNTNLALHQVDYELQKIVVLIEQDKEILALKSGIRKSYETKYENGVATMTELLNKTNEENMAKQHLIVHEIKHLMKLYEYQNKSGN